jgi:hypothetical protein
VSCALKAIVWEFAQAQARAEVRLGALAQAQQRMDLRMDKLSEEQKLFRSVLAYYVETPVERASGY